MSYVPVDFRGLTPKLNQFAGSAVKFRSDSLLANVVCYGMLCGLGYIAYVQYQPTQSSATQMAQQPIQFQERPTDKPILKWRPFASHPDSR